MTGTAGDLASVLQLIKDGVLRSRVETIGFDQIGEGYDRMKRGDGPFAGPGSASASDAKSWSRSRKFSGFRVT